MGISLKDPELQRVLDKAVLGLFSPDSYASTFLTTLYCGLRFTWAPDIQTACTNGISLKINPDWFLTLSPKMRVTLIAHELWHIAYMHAGRCGPRDHQIFNMAADHAINLMLIAHGYHFDTMPNGKLLGLADPKFIGMSAEQIYDKLIEDAVTVELPFGLDFNQKDDNQGEELTPEQIIEVTNLVVKAMVVSELAGEAGHLPGDLTSMMGELLRPRLKWQNLLNKWLTELSEEGYTWSRPNRRYQNVYLPSKAGQQGLTRLLYGIDCSGSLTDSQLLTINSELKGIKDNFNPISMQVVSFDDVIQNVWEITVDDDLSSLEFHGRGGTDMHPIFDMAIKEKPEALIMMSDMDCIIPPKPRGVEVLWICLDRPRWKPPYGKVIHLDTTRDL